MPRIVTLRAIGLGIVLAWAGFFDGVQTAALQELARPGGQLSSAPARRAFLDQYCVTCHNEKLKTGNLTLQTVDAGRIGDAADVWERVAHMLRTGAMPPAGRPRPDAAASQQFVIGLERELDQSALASPNPGRVPPHRLNRVEYVNAVRDLLGVEVPVSLLPSDGSLQGFDNIAGILSVSPTLLERYLSVARLVSRIAVGDLTMNVAPSTYMIEGLLKQAERPNEDVPFGARGISVRHNFPLDGDYVVQVRLKRDSNEYIRGLGREPQRLEIRLDGQRLKQFAEAGLTKGMPPPEGYTQDELGDPQWEKNALDGDAGFEARVSVKAGMHVVVVALPAKRWRSDEEFILPTVAAGRQEERDANITVRTVTVNGPYDRKPPEDSLSRRRIFTCRPASGTDDLKCATTILTALARRAYREPPADDDVSELLSFCRAGLIRGFDGCIQAGLERILASPLFLFRVEGSPEKSAEVIAPA